MLEEAEKVDVPSLDAAGVKKLLLGLEKRITRNQLMRAKHADEPHKFLESESELDEELKRLRVLATAPAMYPLLIQYDSLKSLLSLLTHENSDIAVGVIVLLEDLLDEDAVGDNEEEGVKLIDDIIASGGLELVMGNLLRLEQAGGEEDRVGMYHTLALLANMVSLNDAIAPVLVDTARTGKSLPAFLFRHLRAAGFDDVKSAAGELLGVLVTADPAAGTTLCRASFPIATPTGTQTVDGMEMLLSVLNAYKKSAPGSSDEEECVGNVFTALCTCLLSDENQGRFLAAEGFELMTRMVREAGYVRFGALKCISYAVSGNIRCCEALVDVGGLKEVFPAFMGKGLAHTRKVHGADAAMSEEEHAVAIVSALLQLLPAPARGVPLASLRGPGSGMHLMRVLHKFAENAHEKVDRVVELYITYTRRMKAMDRALDEQAQDDDEEDAATTAQLRYMRRLDNGLATLQKLALIIARLCRPVSEVTDNDAMRALDMSFAVRSKLYEQGGSLLPIIELLVEYLDHRAPPEAGADATSAAAGGAVINAAALAAETRYITALIDTLQEQAGLMTEDAVAAVHAVSADDNAADSAHVKN